MVRVIVVLLVLVAVLVFIAIVVLIAWLTARFTVRRELQRAGLVTPSPMSAAGS